MTSNLPILCGVQKLWNMTVPCNNYQHTKKVESSYWLSWIISVWILVPFFQPLWSWHNGFIIQCINVLAPGTLAIILSSWVRNDAISPEREIDQDHAQDKSSVIGYAMTMICLEKCTIFGITVLYLSVTISSPWLPYLCYTVAQFNCKFVLPWWQMYIRSKKYRAILVWTWWTFYCNFAQYSNTVQYIFLITFFVYNLLVITCHASYILLSSVIGLNYCVWKQP